MNTDTACITMLRAASVRVARDPLPVNTDTVLRAASVRVRCQ